MDCYILKAVTSAPADIHIEWADLGKHRSQSTDPEPFKRNVLFSVRDVLSGLVCLPPPVARWISSDLSVIGHRVAHSQLQSLQIVLSLPVCERLTLYLCAFERTLGDLCVFCIWMHTHTFCLCSLQFKVKACCYGNSYQCTTCREPWSCILHTIFYSTAD